MPGKSVTELGNLEDFLAEAELAGRDFEADRDAKVFQVAEGTGTLVALDLGEEDEDGEIYDEGVFEEDEFAVTMPRRPHWVEGETTADELERMEKDSFLEWRRGIAKLEQKAERRGMHPSPYEKNLQFWRQLWRVMERCDVLVQVADARNPLLFRFSDMEIYAKDLSVHKRLLLLVNKADMLSDELRAAWCDYFESQGIEFVFFSAKQTQHSIDNRIIENPALKKTDILGRGDLLKALETIANAAAQDAGKETGVVGMVGYPNVGKSSVINALLGAAHYDLHAQRVSVSATPGHTKHFQTMNIGPVTLCDCPGLVFPSFFGSKAEMLCNGILPIDEIRGREFMPALELLCERIPRVVLENEYKLKIQLPPSTRYSTAQALIEAYCKVRGLHGQGHGRIDESRGSRLLLKDLVSGRLLYCHPPPGYVDSEEEEEQDQDEVEDTEDDKDVLLTEATDLLTHTHLPVQSEAEILFATEQELHVIDQLNTGPSRRLARHGRKHKKARDKNPYEHSTGSYVAKVAGKESKDVTEFTRKNGF
jgi:large subunit GTPase 1